MSLFDGGGDGGDQGTDGGTGDTDGGTGSDNSMDNAPEWVKTIEGVDPDLVGDPSLKAIGGVNELVKSYVNAQKLIGKDKTILPTEKSSEVEWNQFWSKLGKPEKVEDYKIDLGEDVSFDKDYLGKFTELAHKHNILPSQAQALMKELNEFEASQDANFQQGIEEKVAEAKKQLEGEWGDAYTANITKAVDVVKEFGDDSLLEHFKQTGYGSDPKFLQFLLKVSGTMSEDTVTPNNSSGTGMTPEDIQQKINEAYSDPAYTDPHHIDHKRKVEEVQKLFKMQFKYQASAKNPVGF